MRLPIALLALALVAAACGSSMPPAVASPKPPAPIVKLPSLPGAPGPVMACAGIGLSQVLAGNAADKRVAWLEPFGGGGPGFDLVWPAAYSARFDPDIEILDEHGDVVLRAGDFVEGGCVTAHENVLELAPPFMSLRLQCGPMRELDCTGKIYQAATAAGWPDRDIAELRFVDQMGPFVVTYADGSTGTGLALDR